MMALPELEQTIRKLPPAARKELSYFVCYLQYKYQPAPAGDVVKLGGLWADVNLDVSDDDVRALLDDVFGSDMFRFHQTSSLSTRLPCLLWIL